MTTYPSLSLGPFSAERFPQQWTITSTIRDLLAEVPERLKNIHRLSGITTGLPDYIRVQTLLRLPSLPFWNKLWMTLPERREIGKLPHEYERRGRFEVGQSDILRGLIYTVNQNHEFSLRAERSNSVEMAQRIERLYLRTYDRHEGLF
jgi:hypothetical protein